MAGPWIDQVAIKRKLADFFGQNRKSIVDFGNKVNQTFEAFVFAAVVAWYKKEKWKVSIVYPKGDKSMVGKTLRLKFNTRGRPGRYSFVVCKKGRKEVHIRHQLRVATSFHSDDNEDPANVCLDVAVIHPTNVSGYSTNTALPNDRLITFGEAKHMSAFAELVANFVGLAHEMQPERLGAGPKSAARPADHVSPFLYVSGTLFTTARGMWQTILNREYDIDLFHDTKSLTTAFDLPESVEKKRPAKRNIRRTEEADIPF